MIRLRMMHLKAPHNQCDAMLRQAAAHFRQASAHVRQCSWCAPCLSHSAAHASHASAHALHTTAESGPPRDMTRIAAAQMSAQSRSRRMHAMSAAASDSPRHASAHTSHAITHSTHASIHSWYRVLAPCRFVPSSIVDIAILSGSCDVRRNLAAPTLCSTARNHFIPFIIVSCIVARFATRISCAGIMAASAVAFMSGMAARSLRIESLSAVQAGVADIFMPFI